MSSLLIQKNEKKIPVGILGATGMVGQKFIELLTDHPWFEIVALAASDKSIGKKYAEAVHWRMPTPLDPKLGQLTLQACQPNLPCQLIFSSLSTAIAGPIEEAFARQGYTVISNSSSHRMQPQVPLLIPEVNPEHLELLKHQSLAGKIITNPNCSVIGIALALKPLIEKWDIEKCFVVTLQAISGAGYPGVAAYDIMDNIIPYIAQEEEKIEQELLKIFGNLKSNAIENHSMRISAQCNRVPVVDGHLACISIKLKQKAQKEMILEAWRDYSKRYVDLQLPSNPPECIIYHPEKNYPQPKLHRHLNKGMSVSIGGLRTCALLDWKFNILSHNTIRGAAGGALLNAELLIVNQIKERIVKKV